MMRSTRPFCTSLSFSFMLMGTSSSAHAGGIADASSCIPFMLLHTTDRGQPEGDDARENGSAHDHREK
uniref:Putative secreted peptide n=1 Tax=Anopheles braziliensis TaxID=58242 RepID=A0A2M3ZXN7_9DIPT